MSSNHERRGNGKMLKGCQRKIIVMKNTGSNIFEEAYFVLRENAVKAHISETDMIEEANRIIKENGIHGGISSKKTRQGIPSYVWIALSAAAIIFAAAFLVKII